MLQGLWVFSGLWLHHSDLDFHCYITFCSVVTSSASVWEQLWLHLQLAESLQSYPTLYDPMDCSPPGSSVHGDSPGKNTGVVAMPSSGVSSWPRGQTQVFLSPNLAGGLLTASATYSTSGWPHICKSINLTKSTKALCIVGNIGEFQGLEHG